MSVLGQLVSMVVANPDAREIVMTPHKLAELRKESFAACLLVVGYDSRFLGLPIRKAPTRAFCRNCGAPIEPVCSYCKSLADYVELMR